MAEKKSEAIKLVSPKATARYPWINKADTKFKPEGEFKVDLIVPKEDDFITDLTRHAEDNFNKVKAEMTAKGGKAAASAKKLTLHVPYEDEYDDNGDETGNVIVKVRSAASGTSKDGKAWTRKIYVFDSKGKELKDVPPIFGGSVLRVEVIVNPFDMAATNLAGINLYIGAVQIIELSTGSGSGGDAESHGFGVEEGYEADEDAASPFEDSEGEPEEDEDEDEF